jgi:hypothetical protein
MVVHVASDSPSLFALMGRNGAEVIKAQTRDEMIAKARKYIDGLLRVSSPQFQPWNNPGRGLKSTARLSQVSVVCREFKCSNPLILLGRLRPFGARE